MPIRFRCAYCNQLLGIARRKAGTVVRCPTCAGQVVVPNPEPAVAPAPPAPNQPVFERSDFDQLFKGSAEPHQPALAQAPLGPAAVEPPPAGAWGTHAEPAFEIDRLEPFPAAPAASQTAAPPALVLTPLKATLLAVAAILAVAFAFGAGLVVGYLLK